MPNRFVSKEPQLEDYWRGIILLGKNSASYKFALAKTLLELQPKSGELVKIEDLAPTYSRYLAEHIRHSDKQGGSKSSKPLTACRKYNVGEIDHEQLTNIIIREGFKNVIDAFHVVGPADIPKRFYIDERKKNKGIRITDEFSELVSGQQHVNLPQEVEARWRLVETAWELGVSRNLLSIDYDNTSESLFVIDSSKRRRSVTGSREALSGYQKGKCFYCYSHIDINASSKLYPDVDHFFPHLLRQNIFTSNIDGVWNLVLSCQECNRGQGGKFSRVPVLRLLKRLHIRNEYLISSHHPLRETLIQQTGSSEKQRKGFLNDFYNRATSILVQEAWEPKDEAAPCF